MTKQNKMLAFSLLDLRSVLLRAGVGQDWREGFLLELSERIRGVREHHHMLLHNKDFQDGRDCAINLFRRSIMISGEIVDNECGQEKKYPKIIIDKP